MHRLKTTYLPLLLMTLALLATFKATAQNDATLSQYYEVKHYYNPATIGTNDFINIHAGARLQWVGMTNAPKDFMVMAETPFKMFNKRFGAGLVFQQNSEGLFSTMLIDAQLGYRFKVGKGQLNVGLNIGYLSETFKGSKAELPEDSQGQTSTDPAIPTSDVSGSALDLGLGVHYTHKYFWMGLSATHLTQPKMRLSASKESSSTTDEGYEFTMSRNLYFMAGSNIQVKNTLLEIMPSVLVRTDFKTVQADITARFRLRKFISFGVGYRTQSAVMLMVGAEFKNVYIGFDYDIATSKNLLRSTYGSFELFVGYSVKLDMGDKNKNKHKSIRLM